MSFTLVWITVTLVSATMTWLAQRYARARAMLDLPGQRRSHQHPTARGGGVSLAILAVGAGLWAFSPPLSYAICLAALVALCAAAGWWDDHRPLPARVRLAVQAVTALLLVALFWFADTNVPDLAQIALGKFQLGPWLSAALSIPAVIWLVNLYNFMDGADGLAVCQALFVLGCYAVLGWNVAPQFVEFCLLMTAACVGFAAFNLPPARIFMGDVGSWTLGVVIAILSLMGAVVGFLPPLVAFIINGAFVIDATITLVVRLRSGQRWYTAHRRHAYQALLRAGLSHRAVLAIYIAANLLVFAPLAFWARQSPVYEWPAAMLASLLGALGWWGARIFHRRRLRPRP